MKRVVLLVVGFFLTLQFRGNVYAWSYADDPYLDQSVGYAATGFALGQPNYPAHMVVDSEGNIFYTEFYGYRITKISPDGEYISSFGQGGTGNGEFNSPYGLAIDSSDNLYVVDYHNDRVEVFDSEGNYLRQFGSTGTGNGQLDGPIGVALDSSGNVYVADANNCRIVKFDSSGEYVSDFGEEGTGNGQLYYPYDVYIDSSDNVFVADNWNSRIQKFDTDGNYVSQFDAGGELYSPDQMVVDSSSGNMYIADTYNYQIVIVDSNGDYVSKFGTSGTGDGELTYPVGVVIVGDYLYVSESDNDRIQKFDLDGNHVATYFDAINDQSGYIGDPQDVAINSLGEVFVLSTGSAKISKFDANGNFMKSWGESGSGNGQFSGLASIAVDADDNVYTVEGGNDRVQVFDTNGNYLRKWGSSGTGDGQFRSPRIIRVDADGCVYVVDSTRDDVQKFDSEGNFEASWGESGSGDGQFDYPTGIAIDADGYVYVADYGQALVQKFDSEGNFETSWGESGTGEGQFSGLYGVGVDLDGYVYTTEANTARIQKFDSEGNLVMTYSKVGNVSQGGIAYPRLLEFDSSGNMFVTSFTDVILKFVFDREGPTGLGYRVGVGAMNDFVRPTLRFKMATDALAGVSSYSIALDSGKVSSYVYNGIPITGGGSSSSHVWKDDDTVKIVYLNENDSSTDNDEIEVYFKGLNNKALTDGRHTWSVTATDGLDTETIFSENLDVDYTAPYLTDFAMASLDYISQGKVIRLSSQNRTPSLIGRAVDDFAASTVFYDNGLKDEYEKVSSAPVKLLITVKKLTSGTPTSSSVYSAYSTVSRDFLEVRTADDKTNKYEDFFLTLASPLVDGYYQVEARLTDGAGNYQSTTFYLNMNYWSTVVAEETEGENGEAEPVAVSQPIKQQTQAASTLDQALSLGSNLSYQSPLTFVLDLQTAGIPMMRLARWSLPGQVF